MNINMVQRFPAARAKRIRALYELVRSKDDWMKPVSASVDEPALFAYLPDAQRQEAREAMMRDLQEAVSLHTGEPASVFIAVNGNAIRYHVRAAGHRMPPISAVGTRAVG
jgi:hypothetical protein